MTETGERALVIGLGKSGIAVCEVLRQRNWEVLATDEYPERAAEAVAYVASLGVTFVPMEVLQQTLRGGELAVLSPGVPPSSRPVAIAWAMGCTVIGEAELAWRFARAPFLAVTGTKGKSTTSALLAHLLRAAGKRTALGGNIGEPLIREVLPDGLDAIVAELSSFQLESIDRFHARVAVLLNISPDHLDRYASMDEYASAKYRIVENAVVGDTLVANRDDERVWCFARSSAAQMTVIDYSLVDPSARIAVIGDRIVDTRAGAALAAVGDVPLIGRHNLANAMAALGAALSFGVDPQHFPAALRSFAGMAHRLQLVAEIGGVRYIDDSKATNPEAAIAALESFAQPVVAIVGGRAKGTAFDALGDALARHARAVLAIGEAAAEIESALAARVPSERPSTMAEAVERASALARPGDVVLLSPACASFDMFRSAEHRGEEFVAAVRARAGGDRA
uniref:UDP-N-acetylmuramoylalanine-D-glutamate ligase n=1 Tax=mine drainage metagenome TaxID=410659 RepID=E6PGT6_9ZZZZ